MAPSGTVLEGAFFVSVGEIAVVPQSSQLSIASGTYSLRLAQI